MAEKKGNLSINSENLFPIIKKWLYSDHDIFVRELVSNACDAMTKLKKLSMMGEIELDKDEELKVSVLVNAKEKTLTFIDHGIGMTADEVEKYITQIAFSGATAFMEKYKDKANQDQIIGHFGLGFYSAFMVADKVTIDTLSYQEGAKGVHWECTGDSDYTMEDTDLTVRGTKITLEISDESIEFANEYRIREVLEKYCSFMPFNIYLTNEEKGQEYETIPAEEVLESDTVVEYIDEPEKTQEVEKEDGSKETKVIAPACKKAKINKRPVPINETTPLWSKHPNECSEEEYKNFYTKVFHDYKEPLFWIHLNMDYPFNLKGILYFPKINMEYESVEGVIKLYNNQVFVADNIKEVIPEFLMLLKGVIDCPDLPLNVSRSALQNDGFVKKISDYITKKVADKLSGMCKTDRETYEKYWDDIAPFIEYGCLKDSKFEEKMNDYVLFKDIHDKYQTLPELLKSVGGEDRPEDNKEEKDQADSDYHISGEGASEEDHRSVVYYVTDPVAQSQYVKMFMDNDMNAVILKNKIDQPYISNVEQKHTNVKFARVDSDITEAMKSQDLSDEDSKAYTESLTKLFKNALNQESISVKVESFKDPDLSSMITLSEESRRMQDMMRQYGMYNMGDLPSDETLVLNANNVLVKYLLDKKEGDQVETVARQLYDLARVSHEQLPKEEMTAFIKRSNEILKILIDENK